MTGELVSLSRNIGDLVPAIIADLGDKASTRYLEFFTANIRNPNTRAAYAYAAARFLGTCERHGLSLHAVQPIHVAAYVEQLQITHSKPTVKQHLAALRMLFDWLVTGQIIPANPAAAVRGPKHIVNKGKTPVLSALDARTLLDSIRTEYEIEAEDEHGKMTDPIKAVDLLGLRDRALIAVMAFSFARIGAVLGMKVEDYYQNGKRWWLRLHEKGGKFHEVPAHHLLDQYLDAYIKAAGIEGDHKGPLFRSARGKTGLLTVKPLRRNNALDMVKRRAKAAGFTPRLCCHTFRATGITAYLQEGGTIEKAQKIAAHSSPKTTKLYDRTSDQITLDEIERIRI